MILGQSSIGNHEFSSVEAPSIDCQRMLVICGCGSQCFSGPALVQSRSMPLCLADCHGRHTEAVHLCEEPWA